MTGDNESLKNQQSERLMEIKRKEFHIEELEHRIKGLETEIRRKDDGKGEVTLLMNEVNKL